MKTCPNGHIVPDNAAFCTECGAPLAAATPQPPQEAGQPTGQPATDQYVHQSSQQQGGQQAGQQAPPTGAEPYQQPYQQPQQQQYQQQYQQYQQQQQQQQQQYQQYQQHPPHQQGPYPPQADAPLTGFKGVVRQPGMVILLSIVTCGIYAIWWMYTISEEINSVLGYEATKPIYAVVGTFCCMIFQFILMSQIDNAIVLIDKKRGIITNSKFLVWVLLSIFLGIGVFMMQYDVQTRLNSLYQGGN